MEIVEKIEELYYLQSIIINRNQCVIITNIKVFNINKSSKKEAVVQAIWGFLQWYNQNNTNNENHT